MIVTLLIGAVLFYLGLAVYAHLVADRQIFLPPTATYDADELDVVLVETADGAAVATLHLPNAESTYTILYSHGNAEDLGHLAPILEQLRRAGFSILAYDYRGYGLSTGGPPTTKGAYLDAAAVYHYATEQMQIPPSQLIVYGRSVGSGPAVHLAANTPVAGLVVESGFTSAFRVVTHVPLLPFDRFPNLRTIRGVACPVLIIHGEDDRVISFSHGRQLYAVAREPKLFLPVPGAGHNDVPWIAGDAYVRAMQKLTKMSQAFEKQRARAGLRAE